MTNFVAKDVEKKGIYYGWVVVGASFFLLFTSYGAGNAYGVFLKPLLEEFGWTRAQVSGAAALYMLIHGFLAIVAGMLSDRYGPRRVVTFGAVFSGLAYVLVSQSHSLWQLYLYYGFVLSLGMSTVWSPITSTVTRWFREKRGLALGIVTSGVGMGIIVMPPLATYTVEHFGWRNSFLILGIVVWVFAISASFLIKPAPMQQENRPRGAAGEATSSAAPANPPPSPAVSGLSGMSVKEAISSLPFWLLFAVSTLEAVAHQTVLIHIVPHATDIGISTTVAALVLTTIGIGNVIGRLLIGFASDRAGSRGTLLSCFAVQGVMLLWLIGMTETWMFFVFAVFFGMTYAATMPMFAKLAAEYFGLRSTGTIIAVWLLAFALGGAFGSPFAGYIFDTTGNYSIAFLTAGVVMFVALVLTSFAQMPQRTVQPPSLGEGRGAGA